MSCLIWSYIYCPGIKVWIGNALDKLQVFPEKVKA
jgi:hypothetical protein